MPRQRPSTRAASPKDEPLVLRGPPNRLRATVTVENASDTRLTVRGSALRLEGGPVVAATAAARIGPGSTASLPILVRLDPSTPPGTYAAELEVSGTLRPSVVHVEPHPSLTVTPGRVLAAAGRQPITLSITNDGNVAMPLAPRALASTSDGGPEAGPDVALDLDNGVTVDPGAEVTLTGHVEVPDTLDPARRHTATIPVGVADLVVIILPLSAPEAPS